MSLLRQDKINSPSGQRGRCCHCFLFFSKHTLCKKVCAIYIFKLHKRETSIHSILFRINPLREMFAPSPQPMDTTGVHRSRDELVSRIDAFYLKEDVDCWARNGASYAHQEHSICILNTTCQWKKRESWRLTIVKKNDPGTKYCRTCPKPRDGFHDIGRRIRAD